MNKKRGPAEYTSPLSPGTAWTVKIIRVKKYKSKKFLKKEMINNLWLGLNFVYFFRGWRFISIRLLHGVSPSFPLTRFEESTNALSATRFY